MSRKMLTPLNLLTRASDPSSGIEGDTYFNTVDQSIRIYNGAVWVTIMKSTDPIPFYEHTHTYDGDVHSIDVSNIIVPLQNINNESLTFETLPDIIGIDGGSPESIFTEPSESNFSLLDGGHIVN
jgi:hypothetical protein